VSASALDVSPHEVTPRGHAPAHHLHRPIPKLLRTFDQILIGRQRRSKSPLSEERIRRIDPTLQCHLDPRHVRSPRVHSVNRVAGGAMRWLTPALAFFNLCGTSGGEAGDDAPQTFTGDGWALQLPSVGAKVQVAPDRISVDARDYSRWFDVRWEPDSVDLSVPARTWAAKSCDPAVWERPIVRDDSWTAGGLCTRGSRYQWLIARVERVDGHSLAFFYVANPDFLAFEDAWVDFTRTAATLTAGAMALPPADATVVRQQIRGAAADVGHGTSPLPGGGVLSTHVIEGLAAMWETRRAASPPPRPFAAEAP
jgi:hypothetical protein